MRWSRGLQGCKKEDGGRRRHPTWHLRTSERHTQHLQPAVRPSPPYPIPRESVLPSPQGNRNICSIFHRGIIRWRPCSFSSSTFLFVNLKINVSIGVVGIKNLDCTFSSCFLTSERGDVSCRTEVILLNWLEEEKGDKGCYFEEDTLPIYLPVRPLQGKGP